MNKPYSDFAQARDEVSASSAGGAPFLLCYGATFIITGILAFFLPRETSALIAMFQGGVALPLAFWLERRWGTVRMSPDNPLTKLSAQLAISQALAIPFLIVLYNVNPDQIPVALAGLGGVHFMPYSWLHRTQVYVALGTALTLGSFALILLLSLSTSYIYILLFVGVAYLIAAPLVFRHARQLVAQAAR
jgi:hypothetical protein